MKIITPPPTSLQLLAVISVICAILLTGCEREELVKNVSTSSSALILDASSGQTFSPYHVGVMRQAATNLFGNSTPVSVDTTHVYASFTATDSLDVSEMLADETVDWFEHPLWDYDTNEEYEAAELVGDTAGVTFPHTFYAVFEYGALRPDAAEVIEWLHLPETRQAKDAFTDQVAYWDYLDELEDEAFSVVDAPNPYKGKDGEVLEMRSNWTPEGLLTVDDVRRYTSGSAITNLGPVPICEVNVKVYRGLRSESGYTDCKGAFRLNNMRRSAKWKIRWKDYDIKVANAIWTVRTYTRPGGRTKSQWNHNFEWHSLEWDHATLINSTQKYKATYHLHGLNTPYHQNQLMNVRTVYSSSQTGRFIFSPPWNRIKIWTRDDRNGQKTTDELHRLMAHELTHSAYYKHRHVDNTSKLVRESYADFVEHLFCTHHYNYFNNVALASKQDRRFTFSEMSNGYSAVFIDLIDDFDQCTEYGNRPECDEYPADRVNGYTPQQIQNVVLSYKKIEEIGNQLATQFSNNPTAQFVDELINGYEAIE